MEDILATHLEYKDNQILMYKTVYLMLINSW